MAKLGFSFPSHGGNLNCLYGVPTRRYVGFGVFLGKW